MSNEDPYADFRDSKGRFKKGNPGGPGGKRKNAGRPQEWVDGKNAIKEWGTLIDLPPRCFCGGRSYRYKKEGSVFFALCNHCDEELVYDDVLRMWRRFRFFG